MTAPQGLGAAACFFLRLAYFAARLFAIERGAFDRAVGGGLSWGVAIAIEKSCLGKRGHIALLVRSARRSTRVPAGVSSSLDGRCHQQQFVLDEVIGNALKIFDGIRSTVGSGLVRTTRQAGGAACRNKCTL